MRRLEVSNESDCIKFLCDNDISVSAVSVSETDKVGFLHFIVEDPDRVCELLKKNGFGVGETEVLIFTLPDTTKSLESILSVFKEHNINIGYMYTGTHRQFVFRVDNLEAALEVAKNAKLC